MAACLAPALVDPLVNGIDTEAHSNRVPGSTFSTIVRALGIDAWLAIETVDDEERRKLADAVGRPELATVGSLTPSQLGDLQDAVEKWSAGLTPHSAAQLLQRQGLRAGAVQSIEDVVRDPQLRHRQFPVVLDHPDLGSIEYPGVLHHMSATPVAATAPAGRLGSATSEVLRGWLGLRDDQISDLQASGAIFVATQNP
jgi:CoA:oxalate CoA-transferase